MVYLMKYSHTTESRAHFYNEAGIALAIPMWELNQKMREAINTKGSEATVEVTVLNFPIP